MNTLSSGIRDDIACYEHGNLLFFYSHLIVTVGIIIITISIESQRLVKFQRFLY